MAAVKITVRKNGPYRVEAPEGSIELVDADGNQYDLTGKPAFSLCRCGASVNKPFCDGTHSKMGSRPPKRWSKSLKKALNHNSCSPHPTLHTGFKGGKWQTPTIKIWEWTVALRGVTS